MVTPHTFYPAWAPSEIVEAIKYLTAYPEEAPAAEKLRAEKIASMWMRLVTRPEMKDVWASILSSQLFPLMAPQGFFRSVSELDEEFEVAPKLSEQAYSKELMEIAKLAKALATRIEKFDRAAWCGCSPFLSSEVFSGNELQTAAAMLAPDQKHPFEVARALDRHLPAFSKQLIGVAASATKEAKEQSRRLDVSRKANDKNAFRTFFIRSVAWALDYSPAKVAIFASVALDDPDISADLVRGLLPKIKR